MPTHSTVVCSMADGAKFWSHIIVCVFSAFSSKLGYEEHIPGQTRDWNEELQTTRELPRKNLPERLLRERAIFKVSISFKKACLKLILWSLNHSQ